MLQTVLLCLINICSIFFTVYLTKSGGTPSFKNCVSTIYAVGLIMPLFEESLFRGIFKQCLSNIQYSEYINGLFFGLFHFHNYFVHNNLFITAIQMATTSYLGYYVVQFDNFIYAFVVHSLYNISIVVFSSLIVYYVFSNEKENKDSRVFMCPRVTQDDMMMINNEDTFTTNKYKFIKENKIPKDVVDRIDKMRKITVKRSLNFQL